MTGLDQIQSRIYEIRGQRVMLDRDLAELYQVTTGALNQAVKAIAIARGFVAPGGIDLVSVPAFTDIEIEGEERTAIKLRCRTGPAVCI